MNVSQVTQWITNHQLITLATSSALMLVLAVTILRALKPTPGTRERRKLSAGVVSAIIAFVCCTSLSLNTSYGFTKDGFNMDGTFERVMTCATYEALMAMCVLGARERMAAEDGDRSPGVFGTLVWVLAGAAAVPAWHEGHGLTVGTFGRIAFGAVGSAVAAHVALGLELRHRTGDVSQSVGAQIARELRERAMARLGLAQRGRDAQTIAEERALTKAVGLGDRYHRLEEDDQKGWKGRRLARRIATYLDRAGCATDPQRREEYRTRLAMRRYAAEIDVTKEMSPLHEGAPEGPLADLAERVRRMEDLAAEVEGEVMAQIGTSRSGAVPAPRAELPPADEHDADEEPTDCLDEEKPADPDPERVAAAHPNRTVVNARVPVDGDQEDEESDDQDDPDEDDAEARLIQAIKATKYKKIAIKLLYDARKTDADKGRKTNAITDGLLTELRQLGINLDRGAANRYVAEFRGPDHYAAEAASETEQPQPERELINA
ncbi:hypothetical protein [Streptomyces sp. NRRL WC-3742]|uniref:hypothetical protein n=1 Tax=Streptomyces sp. NRRL WC-3742 TaxID=1463934 RepID=UPI0004C70B5B|nr:hypothetical protein [Streptomyces sp. NRRL WC-3742]